MIINADGFNLVQVPANDPDLVALANIPGILENMSEVRSWATPMPQELVFKLDQEGTAVGEVRLYRLRWYNRKAELGVIIHPAYRGQGLAYNAINVAMRYAFNYMNLWRIEAETLQTNVVSMAILEKLGFVQEGVLRQAKYVGGRYFDIIRWGILRPEFEQKNSVHSSGVNV